MYTGYTSKGSMCTGYKGSMCTGYKGSMCTGYKGSMCTGYKGSMCTGYKGSMCTGYKGSMCTGYKGSMCTGYKGSMCTGYKGSMCTGYKGSMCTGYKGSMCTGYKRTRLLPSAIFPHSIWRRNHAQNSNIWIFYSRFRPKIHILSLIQVGSSLFSGVILVLSPCESEAGMKSFPLVPHMSQLSSYFLHGFAWRFPSRIFFLYI